MIPKIQIELANIETNTSREAVTNTDGDFEIPYVSPGTYRLTASASGFKNFVASHIVLRARETRSVDVSLESARWVPRLASRRALTISRPREVKSPGASTGKPG